MGHNVPNVPHYLGAHGAHLPRGMCLMCSSAVCPLGTAFRVVALRLDALDPEDAEAGVFAAKLVHICPRTP
jgi:hypothetical protein